jgi:hypothetical protein
MDDSLLNRRIRLFILFADRKCRQSIKASRHHDTPWTRRNKVLAESFVSSAQGHDVI